MKTKFKLKISDGGHFTVIYSDVHARLIEASKATTRRASNVEPGPGGWFAHIIGGPSLGPFRLRQVALDAEVAHLERLLFGTPQPTRE